MNLLDLTKSELERQLTAMGIQRFRADQIYHHIYKEKQFSVSEMLNLSKATIRLLEKQNMQVHMPTVLAKLSSSDGDTIKLLLALEDGNTVETVLMKHPYGNSVCVSSQVGCAMGCEFCASTKNGFVRNLTSGEMVAQLLAFRANGIKSIHSVVIMGTGEPLFNYDQVLHFIHHIHQKESFNLGYRRITLSTCGIVPGIEKLGEENIPITLAISLHAPIQELRSQIMPINRTFSLEEVVAAADGYFAKTGRKITYEYILIDDLTCTMDCAKKLVDLLKGKNCNVNLIPINNTKESNLRRPSEKDMDQFYTYLTQNGINTVIRREKGSDIQAACGQLRIQHGKS